MSANGDLPAATELFEAANKLRGSVESAEYKHLVLGLVFLKYVSDSFDRRHDELDRLSRDEASDYFVETDHEREELLEDRDEYASVNVFWVPAGARWPALLAQASKPEIGVVLDRALDDIESLDTKMMHAGQGLIGWGRGRIQPWRDRESNTS